MRDEQPTSTRAQFAGFLSLLLLVCRSFAFSAEVFLHDRRTFGQRYPGGQGALAAVLLFFWPVLWPQRDPRPMLVLFVAYLIRCAVVRCSVAARLRRGGAQEHSRYTGWPLLMRVFPRMDELKMKSWLEPVLLFLLGVCSLGLSIPLGVYMLCASFGLSVAVSSVVNYEHTRTLDMHDAFIDQRNAGERFRAMRRD